jgi:hypothetical protein
MGVTLALATFLLAASAQAQRFERDRYEDRDRTARRILFGGGVGPSAVLPTNETMFMAEEFVGYRVAGFDIGGNRDAFLTLGGTLQQCFGSFNAYTFAGRLGVEFEAYDGRDLVVLFTPTVSLGGVRLDWDDRRQLDPGWTMAFEAETGLQAERVVLDGALGSGFVPSTGAPSCGVGVTSGPTTRWAA